MGNLQRHKKDAHSTSPVIWNCTICDFRTKSKNGLKIHINGKHLGLKPYACSKCDYRCTKIECLKRHDETCHSSVGERNYQCDFCGWKSFSEMELKKHGETHLKDREVKCDDCGFLASGRDSLKIHSLRHTKENKFECSICAYTSKTKSSLTQHQRMHSTSKHLECEICDFKTNYPQCMMGHLTTHRPEKQFKCEHPSCQFSTETKAQLVYHSKQHKAPSYKCDFPLCPFVSKTNRHLKNHKLKHETAALTSPTQRRRTGIYCKKQQDDMDSKTTQQNKSQHGKIWKCDLCQYSANHKVSLKQHLVVHFPASFPTLKCPLCHFETKQKSSLQNHKATHETGEDFKCDLDCGYVGKREELLLKHIKMRHGKV